MQHRNHLDAVRAGEEIDREWETPNQYAPRLAVNLRESTRHSCCPTYGRIKFPDEIAA